MATSGGYFSGGQSILILTVLALLGIENMHELNAFKTPLASCINGVTVIPFLAGGAIIWPLVLLLPVREAFCEGIVSGEPPVVIGV